MFELSLRQASEVWVINRQSDPCLAKTRGQVREQAKRGINARLGQNVQSVAKTIAEPLANSLFDPSKSQFDINVMARW
ncbi:hypothetical protein C1894_13825 [Pseudomonas sp. FW305-3-2-15-E-TSA2]|jgi:hypothetical protein|nr:hypothetical protein C1895_23005 [Pseudomonas sp. FW305-3-2-15-E-TSA4]POA41618.1 hypothetical protein C1894_13825 [Pseudomonas sp. FW305-3-2-15-E-TSA2]